MAEKDLENGQPPEDASDLVSGWDPNKDEGEYANLIRYISTYRDSRFSKAQSQVSEDVIDHPGIRKAPFYKRWFTNSSGRTEQYHVPTEWLNTNIKQGLTCAEVVDRRSRTGWNELTSEKENMFVKFLGYFRGPILYGRVTA